eukprot:5770110-Prymnesium_polylepis.1
MGSRSRRQDAIPAHDAVTAMKQAVDVAIQHNDIRVDAVRSATPSTCGAHATAERDGSRFMLRRFAPASACRAVSCRRGSSHGERPVPVRAAGGVFPPRCEWLRCVSPAEARFCRCEKNPRAA